MIGRLKEKQYLLEMAEREDAQLIAVYGRRRVGKTYLVRHVFEKRILFDHTGLYNAKLKDQLMAFRDSLIRHGAHDVPKLHSWREAFLALENLINQSNLPERIIFLDELPWMDTPKSSFVTEFEHFWDGWASAQHNLMVVFCGSATSWIINKVLKNKGGLHNRVTGLVALEPFTLAECKEYAESVGLSYTELDIAEGYMVFGGVPYYWSFLRKNESLAQSIDRLLFSANGQLRHEFLELYSSLFKEEDVYMDIVSALARKKSGLNLNELSSAIGVAKGGRVSRHLEELEQCGFIRRYTSWGKRKKDMIYQLMDNFTFFHFAFIAGDSNPDEHFWSVSSSTPSVQAWKGLAFERLCLAHVPQLKKALGISGVLTRTYAWHHKPDDVYPVGAQIDLIIERADRIVNVCEIKWSEAPFVIDKEYDAKLRSKLNVFKSVTGIKTAVHLTMVSTFGIVHNMYWNNVQSEVLLEELFQKP